MIPRLLCTLALHAWRFMYAPVGRGYRPEVVCIRCTAVSTHETGTPRALCRVGLHRRQRLTAPPTWRKGDPIRRGDYCVWCAK